MWTRHMLLVFLAVGLLVSATPASACTAPESSPPADLGERGFIEGAGLVLMPGGARLSLLPEAAGLGPALIPGGLTTSPMPQPLKLGPALIPAGLVPEGAGTLR